MAKVEVEVRRLQCLECGTSSSGSARGWRAYLKGPFDGEEEEVGIFCPDCAAREFGDA